MSVMLSFLVCREQLSWIPTTMKPLFRRHPDERSPPLEKPLFWCKRGRLTRGGTLYQQVACFSLKGGDLRSVFTLSFKPTQLLLGRMGSFICRICFKTLK